MAIDNNPFADLPDAQSDPFADLPDAKKSGLLAALGSGIDQLQETGYRAVKGFTEVGENPNDYAPGSVGRGIASAIGQGGALSRWADEGIQRNQEEAAQYQPAVSSYKDIGSVSDAASYVGEMTAQSIPMMAAAFNPVTAFAMGGGLANEAYEEQEDKQPWRAVASGFGQMGLERLGAETAIGRVFGGEAGNIGKRIGQSMLGEGATETGQEALAQWGGGKSIDELENLDEAFVGGAAVGGSFRGATEAGQFGLNRFRPQQELNNDEELDLTAAPAADPDLDPFANVTPESDQPANAADIAVIPGNDKAKDWEPNWQFGQNDMPYRGQMQPYQYEGEYEQYRETPNSVPVGNVLEAPVIDGEYRSPYGLPDRSDVIYGTDGRPQQQAQEFAGQVFDRSGRQLDYNDVIYASGPTPEPVNPNAAGDAYWNQQQQQSGAELQRRQRAQDAQNQQPLLPQKDIIFAGDNRGVQMKKDGKPFGGRRAAELTPEFKRARQQGLNPEVVRVNGGYGWVTSSQSDPFADLPDIGDPNAGNNDLSRIDTGTEYSGGVGNIDQSGSAGIPQLAEQSGGNGVQTDPGLPTATDGQAGTLADGRIGNDSALTDIDIRANEAATSPTNDLPEPTQAQKDAGNYKKGRIKLHGLNISIENPKGSTRSGTDADGNEWQTQMQHHYGDIKATTGADGDAIDVFVGDKPYSQKVFVVDQVDPKTGEFDEAKAMMGFDTVEEAEAAYRANYDDNWQGLGNITETSVDDFKTWLKKPRKSKQAFAKPVEKRSTGKTAKVYTSQGREVDVEYQVREAADLIPSNDESGKVNPKYPQTLQPRDRSRQSSVMQINDISNNINPALLNESANTADGAPIISDSGVVESGNGRTIAINKAYRTGKAEGYRNYLADQGYNVEGMKQPVLVRVRKTPMSEQELVGYTQESNQRSTMEMSAAEQARTDADAVGRIITDFRGGDITSAANRDFVTKFVRGAVGNAEQSGMMDASGQLSQTGKRRIEAAMIASAYENDRLVSDVFESSDSDIRAIGGALLDSSGAWAKMKQSAKSGALADNVDLTPNLMEAVDLIKRARTENRKLSELANQDDIFSGEINPLTKAFLGVFYSGKDYKRARSRNSVAKALSQYAELAGGTQAGDGLFRGELEAVSPQQLLDQANETNQQADQQAAGQAPLFRTGDGRNGASAGTTGEGRQRPTINASGQANSESQAVSNTASTSTPSNTDTPTNNSRPVVSAADADKVISDFRAGLSDGAGDNFVVASSYDQLPDDIKEHAKQQGAEGDVKGVFHKGKVFVVLDQHTSPVDLETTLFHEAYGHQGIRNLFGKDITQKLNKLFTAIGGMKGLRETAARHGINLEGYISGIKGTDWPQDVKHRVLMDELLAHLQQDNKPSVKRMARELVGAVRQGLKKLGLMNLSNVSDSDLFYILRQARKASQKGDAVDTDVPLFRRTEESESPAFRVPDETMIQKYIIRRLQDKFSRVKQTQKAIKDSGRNISESSDVYGTEALYYGKVEEDFRQLDEKFIEPMAKKMAAADISQQELDLYLYALHAPERNKHIYENVDESTQSGSGMSDAEAKAIIDSVNRDPRRQQFNELVRSVRKMIDDRTAEMKRQGLIDDETFSSYQNGYKFYVPLKGQAGDEGGKPKGTGAGFNITGKESMKAMGRKSKAESPLIHAYLDTQQAIVRGQKNQVGNAMLNLIEEVPNEGYWNAYTTQGPMKVAQDKDGKKITRPMNHIEMAAAARNPNEPWFATKRDGKQYFLHFADPVLAQQLKNVGVDNGNFVTRVLGSINRYLATMSTSANPEFLFTNASRDIQTALFNLAAESDLNDGRIKGVDIKLFSANVLRDLPKSFNGIRKALRDNDLSSEWSQHFDQFRKNGAKTGYFDMKDLDQQTSALQAMMQLQSKKGMLQYGKKALKFIDDYNSSVENAIRLSVYKNAIDAGVTERQAALLAKDLTVNFNRKGEAGTWLNSLYLFANAGIQGTANFARAIGNFKVVDGKNKLNLAQKAGIVMAGIGFGMAALNRLIAGEDDDGESYWDKVPQHVKERNFVLMMPGSNDYVTLPMPYGYNIFANIGTAFEDVVFGEGDIAENTGWLAKAFMGSFLPLGLGDGSDALATAVKTGAPQILKPGVELIDNTNFFGANIYNDNNDRFDTKKSNAATPFKSTNEFYKSAAMGLNEATGGSEYRSGVIDVHPETIRYLVDYVAGGAGRFVANTFESAKKAAKGEMEPDRTPFVRRFYGKTNDYGDQETFYNRLDEVETLDKELRSLRGPERKAFRDEYKVKLQLAPRAKATAKMLSNLRKQKERAEQQGNSEQVDKIDARMELIIDRFNKQYNESED